MRRGIEVSFRVCLQVSAAYLIYRWGYAMSVFYGIFRSVRIQEEWNVAEIELAIFQTLSTFTFPISAMAIWLLAYFIYRLAFPVRLQVQQVKA